MIRFRFLLTISIFNYLRYAERLTSLSTNLTKWLNTLKQLWLLQQPTNCVSLFDHFVGLMLKDLTICGLFFFSYTLERSIKMQRCLEVGQP